MSDNAYSLMAEVLKKLVAISLTHCHMFIIELVFSVQNLTKSIMDELHTFGETEKALLSSSSFDGAAILRVLLALSSLVASLNEKENDQQVLPKNEQIVVLSQVWDINAALEPLWLELSTCITKIESYLDFATVLPTTSIISTSKPFGAILPLPAGNQNILPYIKSFFVMCEKLHLGQPGASQNYSLAIVSDVEDANTSDGQQKTPMSLRGFICGIILVV